ncbi:MAG: alpha-galactosidase [Pseudomonadota bacterium]
MKEESVGAAIEVNRQSAHDWIANAFTVSGSEPFSFTYDGIRSAALLDMWRVSQSTQALDAQRVQYSVRYRDPVSGLEVCIEAIEHLDYSAVEWVLKFKNTGTINTPILHDIWPLDTKLGPTTSSSNYVLRYADGSAQLVSDFQPRQQYIGTPPITLKPYGGRSSGGGPMKSPSEQTEPGVLPFFNVSYPGGDGFTAGIGWTGQWNATFSHPDGAALQVNAGMERTHLYLKPGEEIRSPSVLLLFWKGEDCAVGQMYLRRLLLAQYSPRVNGQLQVPPVAASPNGTIPFERVTEANMKQGIENIAARTLPINTWWMDAGWSTLTGAGTWASSVGNFDPDPIRFPNGLKPVADAAHANGLKFLLWFEPERVMPNTWMYNNHFDWLIPPSANMPADMIGMHSAGFHLVNLGIPAARDWLRQKISRMITDIGIDIYRQDFNMYPLYYWRSQDAPDREGMTEIQYVTGLYVLLDGLKEDHPELVIDNCAAGGRRIDFEMLRRAFVLTRSDYLWDPVGQQNHTYGLSQWVPISGIGAVNNDVYGMRSGMGYHGLIGFDYYSTNAAYWTKSNNAVTQLNSMRDLFLGDFTPLTGTTNDVNSCVAWEFHRKDFGKGLVQVFRREGCSQESMTLRLSGLIRSRQYQLADQDGGTPQWMTGDELMDRGLTIQLPSAPMAKVITFTLQ